MIKRIISLLVICSALILFSGNAAHADIELTPQSAHAGDVIDFNFRVTNDRTDAFTKSIQIVFPGSPSFETAQASAPAGWSSSVDQLTGTVSSVTFDSGKLQNADTANFVVTAAVPLRSARIVFNVLQTYSDGQVVRWTQDPQSSKQDGGHPAPVLEVEGAVTTTTNRSAVTSTTAKPKSGSGSGSSPGGILLIGMGVAVLYAITIRGRKKRRSNN